VVTPRQGEIWWSEGRNKRRPVLVVTRTDVIPVLARITVAPITRTVRGIPTEIPLDESDGLREECAASFDNLVLASSRSLTRRLAAAGPSRRTQICRALSALADC
jgi:mRNA interferase MazF